jgi:selenophosphate synthase
MADPQTSGGLLIAINENEISKLKAIAENAGIEVYEIGRFAKARTNEEMIRLI